MQFTESDTGAPITPEMLQSLISALSHSKEVNSDGAEFAVRSDHLNSAISVLEQLVAQL